VAMTSWTFCDQLGEDQGTIGDQEAHHLLHVLRIALNAPLTLFDGRGTEAQAIVTAVSRRDLTFRILSRQQHSRPSRPSVIVAASPPKGDRLKWMVEKLTEMGVDRLVLLHTQRTNETPGDTRVDKLRAHAVAACKQCRRPYLLDILPLKPLSSVLDERTKSLGSGQLFIAHPGGAALPGQTSDLTHLQEACVLIGPEGGFADEEVVAAISAGAVPLSWPETILRIETAAVVFGALLMSRCFASRPISPAGS